MHDFAIHECISTGCCHEEWYAIYTKHQHEKTVARTLSAKGFDTLLPLYSTTHSWKTGQKLLSLPLFPCYVFVRAALERRLDIVTTPGIHAVVSQAGKPCPIPAAEMLAIKRAIASGLLMEPHPLLNCGEKVRIKNGPMAGVEGLLARKKNAYRLIISVNILGKAAAVEIDSFVVERVGAPSTTDGHSDRHPCAQEPVNTLAI